MLFDTLLLSCEHGGNQVPPAYRQLFASKRAQRALGGHRGYDLGALEVAVDLERLLGTPLLASKTTRLLIDLNRSKGHPALFSEFSQVLSREERELLVERYYTPHRHRIESTVASAALAGKRLLHIAVHSFTPSLDGQTRTADLALLYDPQRASEKLLCARWSRALKAADPALRIRLNYPYRGNADGLTTLLRKRFPDRQYAGIEIELNQQLLAARQSHRNALARWIASALRSALDQDSLPAIARR